MAGPAKSNARYDFRGAVLEVPAEWTEESVIALTAPGPKPQPVVSLVRSQVGPDQTLELFAAKRIADLSRVVTGLKVEESCEATFGGQRGMLLRLSWQEPAGQLEQRLLFSRFGTAMYVLAMSCIVDQVAKSSATFDAIAASFRVPPPPPGRP